MKTIAICSGKGGAGKTVFASGLATMLAELGAKVLLVDADYSVGGLTYLTSRTDAVAKGLFFEDIVDGTDLTGHISELRDRDIAVIPSSMQGAAVGKSVMAEMSVERVHEAYCEFAVACKTPPLKIDYVIADTRAGLDPVSAGIALASNIVIVLMEQDRVSYRSSHAFVTNVLALGQAKKIVSVSGAEDYYYVPNKVSPGYAQALRSMTLGMPGNVLPGIPLDLAFFNRYFMNIFGYQPQGRSWRRTAFYRHLRNSMAEVINDLPGVRHSFALEIVDTLRFNLWSSPLAAVTLVVVSFYILFTYVFFLRSVF